MTSKLRATICRASASDFTAPIVQDDPGFGWQIGTVPNIQLGIDESGPTFGARSLHLSYAGESEPLLALITGGKSSGIMIRGIENHILTRNKKTIQRCLTALFDKSGDTTLS